MFGGFGNVLCVADLDSLSIAAGVLLGKWKKKPKPLAVEFLVLNTYLLNYGLETVCHLTVNFRF